MYRTILRQFAMSVAAFQLTTGAAESIPVSFYNEVVPIFKRSCNGCHHPGKLKADLDLTTHSSLLKGSKSGPVLQPGDPSASLLLEEIFGEEPSMPKEGDPLSTSEVALIERWISEGAMDDTPADRRNPYKLSGPPVYTIPSVISSAVFSPDGETIAVSGYHEVLFHKSDGSGLEARLVGESPKVESIAFSSDGKLMAVAGGAPAVFGEVQVWNVQERKQVSAYRVSPDSLYGISFSPDNTKIAFGGADKSVRILNVSDGNELIRFDNHSDWVFATAFTTNGQRLLSGSRDRAMKLINVANGQFIDDINKLLESVLCMSRHPTENLIAYGGELGIARIYKISENQGRTAANNDVNLVTEFERQPGPVHSIAYSPDGSRIAIGSVRGEVKIFNANGSAVSTFKGPEGAIFSIAWHPKEPLVMIGGFDGILRIYNPANGTLIRSFVPFPIESDKTIATK